MSTGPGRSDPSLSFDLYGHGVRVLTDQASGRDVAWALLGPFARELEQPALEIRLRCVEDSAELGVPELGDDRELHASGVTSFGFRWSLYRLPGRLLVEFPESAVLRIEPQSGRAEARVMVSDRPDYEILESLLHFCLIELLKHRGLFTIHSALLAANGHGILIPGTTGQGKTTISLALMRAGFDCLSDDHPLFRETDRGVEGLRFPTRFKLTAKTVGFFPELAAAFNGSPAYSGKRALDVHEVFPQRRGETCLPDVLLLPQVVPWPESSIDSVSRGEALAELLPNGMLVTDPISTRGHFDTLARLVRQCRCYRLFFGRDVLELGGRVDRLLEPLA